MFSYECERALLFCLKDITTKRSFLKLVQKKPFADVPQVVRLCGAKLPFLFNLHQQGHRHLSPFEQISLCPSAHQRSQELAWVVSVG